MNGQPDAEHTVERRALWFGLLGGGVAWAVHLLLAYAIAEWGCVAGGPGSSLLGITGVALLLIGLAVVTMLGACAAVFVAYRSTRRLRTHGPEELHGAGLFMARAGLFLSALFAFIILVQSVPIFFFLETC